MPALDATELSKYDVRVNVTGGDGLKKAFFVSGYAEVEVDAQAAVPAGVAEVAP